MAKLRFSYGTMNSGKTLKLLSTAYNFEKMGQEVCFMKPEIDTRDLGVISSRIGNGIERKCLLLGKEETVFDCLLKKYNGKYPDWLFIDESQFLSENQVNQLGEIVLKNVNVWCFGLRTDFQTKLFPGSKRLFEIADYLEEIKSMCQCGGHNLFNIRVKDGKIITDGEQIEIGAENIYTSCCRKCYYKKLLQK